MYNAAPFLATAIESAIRAGSQVEGGWELLLVDNNSTDESPHIISDYASRYPLHIRALRAARQGAPAARNYALRQARGAWIQCLDADDYLMDDKIQQQLALAGPDTDWIIGAYANIYPDGTTLISTPHPDPFRGLVYEHRVGHTIANLYRRATLMAVGGWNQATPYYDDPNLHLRLLQTASSYLLDPEVRSYYRHHTGSRITSSHHDLQTAQATELVVHTLTYLSQHRPDYFAEHRTFFLGALLRRLRIQATYDLVAASRHYGNLFGPTGPYTHTHDLQLVGRYTRLYPYLGFKNLERLRLALAGILPPALKRLAKR